MKGERQTIVKQANKVKDLGSKRKIGTPLA